MNVRVLLFAAARDAAAAGVVELDLPEPATVAQLQAALVDRYPDLGPIAARSAVAVDGRYAGPAHPIAPGAEVALIPPVSGG